MVYDKKYIQKSDPYKSIGSDDKITRSIYYGEVISIDDPTDGGRIKVRIEKFDVKLLNENLPWAFPLIPKFFHSFPKIGEVVRIFLEDIRYPERGRFWTGSVISQPQKIEFDGLYTATSTTDRALTNPLKAPSRYPDAEDVFPDKEDVAILGRYNNDVILKKNKIVIRTGKHKNDDILTLNKNNPATFTQIFEEIDDKYVSGTIVQSDKIAIITHGGNPRFKAALLKKEDRINIFKNGHPVPRGDVLVKALNVIRRAIISHIHGYSTLPADKNKIIDDLEKINFENILQKDIVIN